MTDITNPTMRRFIGKLQDANAKLQEREYAKNELENQIKKVKSLSLRKNVKKETVDNAFDLLMNKFDEVLHRESKIIKNQRIENLNNKDLIDEFKSFETQQGNLNNQDLMNEIKIFEKRFEEANHMFVQLNAKIIDLENQLANKKQLDEKVQILRDSLTKISSQMNESKDRDIKIQAIEEKIRDRVYQDSIRMQRIESLIVRLETKYAEMKCEGKASPHELARVKERIDTLKEKHDELKDKVPDASATLSAPKKQMALSNENRSTAFPTPDLNKYVDNLMSQNHTFVDDSKSMSFDNKVLTPKQKHFDHLLHEAKVPKFEDVLNKSQPDTKFKFELPPENNDDYSSIEQNDPQLPPPPPLPELPKKQSFWQKIRRMF